MFINVDFNAGSRELRISKHSEWYIETENNTLVAEERTVQKGGDIAQSISYTDSKLTLNRTMAEKGQKDGRSKIEGGPGA